MNVLFCYKDYKMNKHKYLNIFYKFLIFRSYLSTDRDSLLASLLDGARAAGRILYSNELTLIL